MGMIEKSARDLKLGDVLAGPGSRVVVGREPKNPDVIWFASPMDEGRFTLGSLLTDESSLIGVEVPDLTPAQQHAEELAMYVGDYLTMCRWDIEHPQDGRTSEAHGVLRERVRNISALLDKIKPPEPPTLAEVLESLDLLMKAEDCGAAFYREYADKARDQLDRARRAGVLKDDKPVWGAAAGEVLPRYWVKINANGRVEGFGIPVGRDGEPK